MGLWSGNKHFGFPAILTIEVRIWQSVAAEVEAVGERRRKRCTTI
ncbi:hypothetical protein NXW89_00140 [Bacteroides thetaiotaomicron]|nr:hypothetical protein [Bacteroides thetaiotaomicron]